jgi:hypothetical protein
MSYGCHDDVEDFLGHLRLLFVRGVVSGDQHLLHRNRAGSLVSDHHLGLPIGTQVVELPGPPHLG